MIKKYAIIPVKEFGESKQRLSRILSRIERADLTFYLLRNMLSQLQLSSVDAIILVAADDAEADKLLPQFSKLHIVKESIPNGGVNSAMRNGLGQITESRSKVLLLPSDLPLITSSAVDRAFYLLDVKDVIINPSKRRDGTNLLGFSTDKTIELHYDDNSVGNHIAEMQKMKVRFEMIEWMEFLTDVDDPEDLKYMFRLNKVDNLTELIVKLKKS